MIDRLCAQLTGTVANKAADDFYKEFNLTSSSFAEYYFKEMKEIFYLQGMDSWPELISPQNTKEKYRPIPIFLSMVCFSPSNISPNSPNHQHVNIACSNARENASFFFSFQRGP